MSRVLVETHCRSVVLFPSVEGDFIIVEGVVWPWDTECILQRDNVHFRSIASGLSSCVCDRGHGLIVVIVVGREGIVVEAVSTATIAATLDKGLPLFESFQSAIALEALITLAQSCGRPATPSKELKGRDRRLSRGSTGTETTVRKTTAEAERQRPDAQERQQPERKLRS